MRILLTVEYNGAAYCGWQRQADLPTVQAAIEDALALLTGEQVTIHGSGRTDTGVHAYRQYAHFDTEYDIPSDKFPYALNKLLPADIKIQESRQVDTDFHARFSAKRKTYLYKIYVATQPSALRSNTHAQVKPPVDITLMQAAASHFEGEHDFRAFMSAANKFDGSTTVRTIYRTEVTFAADEIHFYITGNSFLYNMVRIITAQLIKAGKSRIKPSDIPALIESKNRRTAREIAPACGLYLVDVEY